MAYFTEIQYKDSRDVDVFGRLRASSPSSVLESQFEYTKNSLVFDESLTGAASSTHLPNESGVRLRCTTASGDIAVRQSHRYIHLTPGKSLQVLQTFLMGASKTNVRKRVGFFETNDGVYLEQTSSGLSFVRRTYTSGSVVNNSVAQASWNIDPFDGTGPSGITLDVTTIQTLVIAVSMHRIRVGFFVNGRLWPAHNFIATNTLSVPLTRTLDLPIRFEIENTAAAASDTDLIHYNISATLEGENNREDNALPFTANNGTTTIGVTTRRPILSIRPAATFGGKTNNRRIVMSTVTVANIASGSTFWEIVYNGTLTGAAFASVDANSAFERDVTATAISSGTVIHSGYLVGTVQSKDAVIQNLGDTLDITLNIAGTQDILSLVCTNVSGTSTMLGAFDWVEIL